jgi:predicted RNA-binding Zn ribbon-like protein
MPASRPPRPPSPVPEDVDVTRTLAFVNTLSGRPTAAPAERLISYDALVEWAGEVHLFKPDEADRLAARGRRKAEDAARIVQRARTLRERLHDTFAATSAGRMPGAPTLDALAAELSRWYSHGRLVPDSDRLQWVYAGLDELERPLWEIARAAARVVTSPSVMRVRACAAADCGWWFLDDTKNHSRRWCDMKICGNRDKVRRFRERQRN